MKVRLTDDYKLITDAYNYILRKRSIVQDKKSENYGKEIWHSISYHGRLEDVISKLIDINIKQSKITELSTILKRVKDIEKEMSFRLRNYMEEHKT